MNLVIRGAGCDGSSHTIPHRRASIFGSWRGRWDFGAQGMVYVEFLLMTQRRWERNGWDEMEPEMRKCHCGPLVLAYKIRMYPTGTWEWPKREWESE